MSVGLRCPFRFGLVGVRRAEEGNDQRAQKLCIGGLQRDERDQHAERGALRRRQVARVARGREEEVQSTGTF